MLPGTGTLYFTLSTIWGFPYGEEVVGSIAALTVFFGMLLGISSHQYNKDGGITDGTLKISEKDADTDLYMLEVGAPLDTLAYKDIVTFRVEHDDVANT